MSAFSETTFKNTIQIKSANQFFLIIDLSLPFLENVITKVEFGQIHRQLYGFKY